MGSSFNKIYTKRRSTFNFDHTKDFDINSFQNLIEVFSSNMPSKQDKFPYEIHILDWSDRTLRKDILYGTTPRDKAAMKCQLNTQVLAPVLVCFTHRTDPEPYVAPLEIGMALMSLTYLLQNNGFLTGFCQCIEYPNDLAKKITGEDNTNLRMILPVGQHSYPKNTNSIPNPFAPDDVIHCKYNPIHQNTPNIKYHIDNRK